MGGRSSSAEIAYGFVLKGPQFFKLCNALYRLENQDHSEKKPKRGEEDDEFSEMFDAWLGSAEGSDVQPYRFSATCMGQESDEKEELTIIYHGKDDPKVCSHTVTYYSHPQESECWCLSWICCGFSKHDDRR